MLAQNTTAARHITTATLTIHSHPQNSLNPSTQDIPTLRLRGDTSGGRRIQWAEDAIDNEGMGKKSSKVCCIYHKTHAVGESSSENDSGDSSSSSDDNASGDNGNSGDERARMGDGGSKRGRLNGHSHRPGEGCGKDKAPRTKKSPNAYEKMPKGRRPKGTKT